MPLLIPGDEDAEGRHELDADEASMEWLVAAGVAIFSFKPLLFFFDMRSDNWDDDEEDICICESGATSNNCCYAELKKIRE